MCDPLYKVLRDMSTSCKVVTEIESRIVGARGWRERERRVTANAYRISFGNNENVLELDGFTIW